MKKIIKIASLVVCICFIAGPSFAQLSSDAPALTAAQVAELQKKQTVAGQIVKTNAPAPELVILKAEKIVEPTTPSRLVSITATKADMPVIISQQPTTSSVVAEKKALPADGKPASVAPAPVKKPAITKQGEN
jgi:hypothetical protein